MTTSVLEKQSVEEILADARSFRSEVEDFLKVNGVAYQLNDWLTIKKYCERYKIEDTQVVTNWIRRGIIPPENIKVVEELNGLRLIKAVPYKY